LIHLSLLLGCGHIKYSNLMNRSTKILCMLDWFMVC
jgi:hypothetical protein